MTQFPQTGLNRLAERIVAGEVVFFVGAGFSYDSEDNTAKRLIGRLLARFDAMTALLAGYSPLFSPSTEVATRAQRLRDALKMTFSLKEDYGRLATIPQVKTLSLDYYTMNDWLTSSFSFILEDIRGIDNQKLFLFHLADIERSILASLEEKEVSIFQNQNKRSRHPPEVADELGGKMLFLETMGFANSEVMAGKPFDSDLSIAEHSYGDRLLPRHRVLAWLAREGLPLPCLLQISIYSWKEPIDWPALSLAFRRKVDLQQQKHQKDLRELRLQRLIRSVVLRAQRSSLGEATTAAQLTYLRSMAALKATAGLVRARNRFRHISLLWCSPFEKFQNWREDSWSRDLVSTLLRTRSIVFCGYSGVDPVLHDTIRTVYEEMTRRRGPGKTVTLGTDEEAPAFFLGSADKTEFHGMEILRAASRAIGGGNPRLADHPNYLRFYFKPQEEEETSTPFPLIDELMRWLFHLTYRRRQTQALESDLGRVATILLGHPFPEVERTAIQEEFQKLLQEEKATAAQWTKRPADRFQFERMVGWTEHFQVGLMREFALADSALCSNEPGLNLERLRRSHWYYPACDHTDWAAWGAVVELALRKRISAWQGKTKGWQKDSPWICPSSGIYPAMLYAYGAPRPTPTCLTIRLRPPGGEANSQEFLESAAGHTVFGNSTMERFPGEFKLTQTHRAQRYSGTGRHRPLIHFGEEDIEPFL